MDWEASSKYRSNCEPCSWQFPDILQSCSYELLSLRVAKRVPRVGADDARVYVSHVENVEITRFRSKWDGGTHVAFYIGNEAIKQKTKPLSPKIDLSYCFVTASSFSRCILVLTFCFFRFLSTLILPFFLSIPILFFSFCFPCFLLNMFLLVILNKNKAKTMTFSSLPVPLFFPLPLLFLSSSFLHRSWHVSWGPENEVGRPKLKPLPLSTSTSPPNRIRVFRIAHMYVGLDSRITCKTDRAW